MEPGLTNMILDESAGLPLQETAVDNLLLLSSGTLPPNPADLLGSTKVDQIIKQLADQAEIILFDAPPAIAVTDAAVLGAKVDGVLLVVNAGKTRRDHAERAKEILEKAKVRVVGVTLINAPKDSSIRDYYA
jgi:non-specific protein-tyrosine kinase